MITNLPKLVKVLTNSKVEYRYISPTSYEAEFSRQADKDMINAGLTLSDVFPKRSGVFHHIYVGDVVNGMFEIVVILIEDLIEDSEKEN